MVAFKGRDIINISDFNLEDLVHVLDIAEEIGEKDSWNDDCVYWNLLRRKTVANVFFENSTRTRLSFTMAGSYTGAFYLPFNIHDGTSVKKGETLHDSMKMLQAYGAECAIIRHPCDGAPQWVADCMDFPIINAGDGSHEHPTQTVLDLFTIRKLQESLEGLDIALVGDLKYGRTVHSLTKALSLVPKTRLHFISPRQLQMPDYIKQVLSERDINHYEHSRIEDVIGDVDILYMTRVQEERFGDRAEYEAVKNALILNKRLLDRGVRENLRIMHPLPRNKIAMEIATDVDDTLYAKYFEQAGYGIPTRIALLGLVLGILGDRETYIPPTMESNGEPNFEVTRTGEIKKKEGAFLVYEIEEGTIIDHIPGGQGRKVISYLDLPENITYTHGANLPSRKLGKKDVVKLFDHHLRSSEMNKIALVAPEATINIKSIDGIKKGKVHLPKSLRDIIECTNPHCISHKQYVEHVPTVFNTNDNGFDCHYCDKTISKKEVVLK
jgi:aspartate carbamoyltransferase catalytic subunit